MLLALLALSACRAVVAPVAAPAQADAAATTATTTGDPYEALTANPWQWVSFTSPVEQFDVETPLAYLLTVNEDGTLDIVADCNVTYGTYTSVESSLNIEVGPDTLAACPPESRSDQFLKLLGGAAIYFFQDGNLHIDLFADSGTLVFAPAPAELMADDGEGALAGAQAELAVTLGNLSYDGIFDDQPITLTDGVYTYTEEGSAGQPNVRLLAGTIAHGDLNGDGAEDAVALLEHNTSGTGRFIYLAPVLNVLTEPVAAPALMIEDRIQPRALAIAESQVVAEYIGHGEGDAACCPTQNIRSTYAWQDGGLVEISREELGKVALADLNGTNWQLVDLNGGQEPVLPDTEITLQIDGEQISGFAGCNNYNGEVAVQEDAPQSITVGPLATTMMMCDEPISNQETAYLTRLGSAVMWGYEGGYLALTYETADASYGYLLFVPVVPLP